MVCDMCGSSGQLYKALVEEAELLVCDKCKKFGKVIWQVNRSQELRPIKKPSDEKEVLEIIASDYAEKIRKKRESSGMTQEEFAKKINEKESLMHKVESGNFEPSLELTKKIERFFHIKLTEIYEEKREKTSESKTESFTLGDFIKVKKR